MTESQGGSEGDEILLLSLRQIDCPIPSTVAKVGELVPDLLVEIIVRALALITDGDVQFPLKLPPNIASRHRICTSIAARIKDMGYLYDCGYNQLLYPVEAQTRNLLKWLVERLPRSEEEGAQEVLGASALLNRRIMQALEVWKSKPHLLPNGWTGGSGAARCSAYHIRNFRALPQLLGNKELLDGTVPLYRAVHEQQQKEQIEFSLEHSIFERHALELVSDTRYALHLERDFVDPDSAEAVDADAGDALASAAEESVVSSMGKKGSTAVAQAIKNSLLQAMRSGVSGVDVSAGRGGSEDVEGGSSSYTRIAFAEEQYNSAKQSKMLGSSFQELIQSIAGDQRRDNDDGENVEGSRGTRFMHAVEFGQERETTVAIGTTAMDAAAARAAAADAATAAALTSSAVALARSGMEARKAQQEAEEKARQEELEKLRKEVQEYVGSVDKMSRNHISGSARTKEFEEELEQMNAETEKREKDVLLKRRTLELLPSAADNIKKLQVQCTDCSKRLLELAQEWDEHREPLVEKLREKELMQLKRREKGRQMVEEVKRYRQDMVSMIEDLKEKQDRAEMLNEETAKLPKNINRAMYTHRIMDITASIVKQNKDIEKITNDIRDIQKTVNLSTNSLQRADTFTEELIFTAANDRNDLVMVEIYRQLKNLRAEFEKLTDTVGKIGQQEKALRDLETKIDQEQSRISSNNFDRIKQDLDSIVKENAQLVAQIKAASKHK